MQNILDTHKVILASASPRRSEILKRAGILFEVRSGSRDEPHTAENPIKQAENLSFMKAADVYGQMYSGEPEKLKNTIVIGADTIVINEYDGKQKPLFKPCSMEDAKKMLEQLSGHDHRVVTGVSAIITDECAKPVNEIKRIIFSEVTQVFVAKLTEDEIIEYINTGESMDKAGSYAIQGIFSKYITSINGDYLNVVGLPLARLVRELKQY
jgi:septum formation protein